MSSADGKAGVHVFASCMLQLHNPGIFRTVLENLETGVYMIGRDWKVLFWNQGAEKITGYQRHEVLGRSCRENILANCNEHDCIDCGSACAFASTMHDGKICETQGFLRHKSGHRVPVHLRVTPIRDQQRQIIGAATSFDEQTSTPEPAQHRSTLAAHGCLDVATGAMTHAFTISHLRENLVFFGEHSLPFGILHIQVKELGHIRSTYGAEAADAVLHVVGQTMKHTIGSAGFLGRWAEDEFLVIMPNCGTAELEKAGDDIRKIVNSSGVQWWGDSLSAAVHLTRAMVETGDTMESMLDRVGCSLVPPASSKSLSVDLGNKIKEISKS